jgi:Nucleotidyltransferase domain
MLTLKAAEAIAGRVLAARYPQADALWLAGSIVRGDATPGSDLDLVVLYPKLPRARRQSFVVEGVPAEAFIHDPETLAWYFDADLKAGRPAMLNMVSEGRILGPRPAAARRLQDRARALLAAGPPPFEPEQLAQYRYHLTDRLNDLREASDPAEMVATGVWIYLSLAELTLRGRGAWFGTGKWVARCLKALDPALERQFSAAFEALFARHDARPVIALAEAELARHGGLLFDGYESQAETSSRMAEDQEAG